MKIICFIKTIWFTIKSKQFWLGGFPIMGHAYVEQENGDLICEVCGHKS